MVATVAVETAASSGSAGEIVLSKRDIIELIKCDVVDLTEEPSVFPWTQMTVVR